MTTSADILDQRSCDGFATFTDYNGLIATIHDEVGVTHLYGWETISDPQAGDVGTVPDLGATYGYIAEGAVTVWDAHNRDDGVLLRAGRWFALPGGCRLHIHTASRVIAACRAEYHGTRSFGGPIEAAGRLRYIDGCSDTLLAAPPLLGDPCLNHLHFPPGIVQTMHTHPSVRCGAIARGAGYCETPTRRIPLEPGAVWIIWAGSAHRFITDDQSLDVIAYHPDSDWGPTDEEHPMLNRTWVDGVKIDNTGIEHDPKQLIR
jgi:quercetin dioxygenase-like cupin family protein